MKSSLKIEVAFDSLFLPLGMIMLLKRPEMLPPGRLYLNVMLLTLQLCQEYSYAYQSIFSLVVLQNRDGLIPK